MPIRLVLADDHPLVLDGLAQLFALEKDCQVVARARNGAEALEAVRTHTPDIVVLDLRMPVMDGLEVIRQMKRDASSTKVVVLTGVEGTEVFDAIELGVRGVVLKEMAPQLLLHAVREVAGGGTWVERGAAAHAVDRMVQRKAATDSVAQALTAREVEIAHLVAQGLRNKEVAEKFAIAEGTVKLHLHNIYEKLGIDGRMALVRYLRDKGFD